MGRKKKATATSSAGKPPKPEGVETPAKKSAKEVKAASKKVVRAAEVAAKFSNTKEGNILCQRKPLGIYKADIKTDDAITIKHLGDVEGNHPAPTTYSRDEFNDAGFFHHASPLYGNS